MRTVLLWTLRLIATAAMIGFYFFLKFMIYGISVDFGWGFFFGGVFVAVFIFLVWKTTPAVRGNSPPELTRTGEISRRSWSEDWRGPNRH